MFLYMQRALVPVRLQTIALTPHRAANDAQLQRKFDAANDHTLRPNRRAMVDRSIWDRLIQALSSHQDLASYEKVLGQKLARLRLKGTPTALLLMHLNSEIPHLSHALVQIFCGVARRTEDLITPLENNLVAVLLPNTDEAGALHVASCAIEALAEKTRLLDLDFPMVLSAGLMVSPGGRHALPARAVLKEVKRHLRTAERQRQTCVFGTQGVLLSKSAPKLTRVK